MVKGINVLRLGVIGVGAVALALIGGLILSAAVSAQGPEVAIHSGTAAPGGDVAVTLEAHEIEAPGLGAWTLDITYDPDVVSVEDCEPEEGGVCNPAYGDDVIRVTGASATGLEGDTVLATITFACGDAEDSSDLSLSAEVFADATIGDPQDIDATIEDGSITCEEPPPPPPAATATTAPRVIGAVGSGGPSDGSGLGWLVAALAAAGLAGVVGFGALRVRARKA